MMLLLANHLRHDTQFRMGILMIVPLSVIYFILVLVNSVTAIADPFTRAGADSFIVSIPLYIAVGFFPFYIKNALSFSSSADASWILYTASYDRTRFIDAAGSFIIAFFLLPYIFVLALVYAIITGAVLHVALHFFVVFMLALIQMTVFLYFFAELPFSKKGQKGKRMIALYGRMLFAPLLPVPLYFFVRYLYGDIFGFSCLVLSLVLLYFVIRTIGRKLAGAKLAKDEYMYG